MRGFHLIYYDYAPADDYFVINAVHPMFPHLVVLEVMVETGIVGLSGYLLLLLLLLRKILQKPVLDNFNPVVPWSLVVILGWWPLNVDIPLYSSYWSSFVWWLTAIWIACIGAAEYSKPHEQTP